MRGVELELPPGSDAAGLAGLVGIRTGQPLSVREVRRAVERLWRTGRFSDVVVRAVPDRSGQRIVFALSPVIPVVSAAVKGNVALPGRELLEAAGFLGADRVEAGERLAEAERAVRELYATRGYDQAKVQARAVPGGHRRGAVPSGGGGAVPPASRRWA